MAEKNSSLSVLPISSNWGRLVALWNIVAEYTGDYISGHKYNVVHQMNQNKQKQK